MSQDTHLDTVSVGVARADVTPPVGIRSAGFAGRGPLTRLHDPLYATALVFADGGSKIALVTCDLLGLDADTVAEVRSRAAERTGIPREAITIACTHTHYGPDPYRDQDDPIVVAYRYNLIHVLAGVIQEAATDVRPALLGVGWGMSYIGINRREKRPDGQVVLGQNPEGPIDRAVGVLRIDLADGAPLACVVNFQTHPVSQGGKVDHISADYPGKMREVVEQLTGATCLFVQGASGNINAAIMEPSYEPARTLGTRLGCEVGRVWETVTPQPAAGLGVTCAELCMPRIRYGSPEAAQALIGELGDEIARLTSEGTREGRLRWAERLLERAQVALESWETNVPPEPVVSEVQAWHVGAVALVTAPGEIFSQIGVAVKERSPYAHTFFASCTNDSIGYVPIPEAYADGGYEVTRASQVDPEAAGILTDTCLTTLASLSQTSG